MCGLAGLTLPPLSDHARDGIDGILKGFGWAANPADVTGFANSASFPSIMEYLLDEPEVGTLVIASAGADTQAEQVISLRQRTSKSMAFLWTGSRSDTAGLGKLKRANIPVFYTPDTLAWGLRRLLDYHAWRDRRLSDGFAEAPTLSAGQHQAIARLRATGRTTLSEHESKQLIAAWGVDVTREVLASSAEGTEAGAVRLGVRSAEEVRRAYAEIMASAAAHSPDATISGLLVQEMLAEGVEVIIGVSYDAQLGPMLLFGTGGVMVEVYEDVAVRRCPLTVSESLAMLSEVRGGRLLRGFRGRPPADVAALADTLVRVSWLAVHLHGHLAELDINPLVVLPAGRGVKAVDALAVLPTT
jgi:acetyltransferase